MRHREFKSHFSYESQPGELLSQAKLPHRVVMWKIRGGSCIGSVHHLELVVKIIKAEYKSTNHQSINQIQRKAWPCMPAVQSRIYDLECRISDKIALFWNNKLTVVVFMGQIKTFSLILLRRFQMLQST